MFINFEGDSHETAFLVTNNNTNNFILNLFF